MLIRTATLSRLVVLTAVFALLAPAAASANHGAGFPEIPNGSTIGAYEFSAGHTEYAYGCWATGDTAQRMHFARVTGTGKQMTVSSHYATTDVVLFVWRLDGAVYTAIDCVDDVEGGNGRNGRVAFASNAGATYVVGIGKLCTGDCSGGLPTTDGRTFFNAFDNDTRATARSSSFGTAFEWTNAGAEDGGDAAGCKGTVIEDGTWFRYNADSHGTATFHLSSLLGILSLHVYRPDGSLVDCAASTGSTNLKIDATNGPGEYLVQVGAVDGSSSSYGGTNFTLHTTFAPDHDLDDDGVNGTPGSDCNDGNPSIKPGIADVINNDVDENCDGIREYDGDGDNARVFKNGAGGFEQRPGADCDDGDPARHPGAAEVVGNGKDENCDAVDEPFPRIRSSIKHDYDLYRGGYMKLTTLRITGLVLGSKVEVRCSRRPGARKPRRGTGCPFTRRTVTRSARTTRLDLLPLVRNRKIGRNLNIDVNITKPGMVGRTKRIWLPARSRKARFQYACLDATNGRRFACS